MNTPETPMAEDYEEKTDASKAFGSVMAIIAVIAGLYAIISPMHDANRLQDQSLAHLEHEYKEHLDSAHPEAREFIRQFQGDLDLIKFRIESIEKIQKDRTVLVEKILERITSLEKEVLKFHPEKP